MTTTRFHVNPATGRVGKCEAEPGKCPHGENTAHGDTKQEARAAYEKKKTAAGQNLAGGLKKQKKVTVRFPEEFLTRKETKEFESEYDWVTNQYEHNFNENINVPKHILKKKLERIEDKTSLKNRRTHIETAGASLIARRARWKAFNDMKKKITDRLRDLDKDHTVGKEPVPVVSAPVSDRSQEGARKGARIAGQARGDKELRNSLNEEIEELQYSHRDEFHDGYLYALKLAQADFVEAEKSSQKVSDKDKKRRWWSKNS